MHKEFFNHGKDTSQGEDFQKEIKKILNFLGQKEFVPEDKWVNQRVLFDLNNNIIAFLKSKGFDYPPISLLEEIVKYHKQQVQRVKTKTLPMLLHEHGISSCITEDGRTVKLSNAISIKVKDEEKFFDFLTENGYEDAIKSIFEFKGSDKSFEFSKFLKEKGISFSEKKEVHHKTRESTVKKLLAAKKTIPSDTAEVVPFEICKISKKRSKPV